MYLVVTFFLGFALANMFKKRMKKKKLKKKTSFINASRLNVSLI